MYFSFLGTISYIKDDYIVIDVDNIGYQIFVSHIENYKIGEIHKVFVYNIVREDEQYLAGFSSLQEKEAFVSLIQVKGIGPRTALNALSATDANTLFAAIASNNVAFLKKLPGIGAKAASQIILDLKGQLTTAEANPSQYDEVREALKSLGFKVKRIDEVLASINIPNATNDEILKAALRKMK